MLALFPLSLSLSLSLYLYLSLSFCNSSPGKSTRRDIVF